MTKGKPPVRILVADDHAIFRDGLRKLLEGADDVTIIGEASNGNECVKMLAKLKPDILLLDLRMPEKDGLGVLEAVSYTHLDVYKRQVHPKLDTSASSESFEQPRIEQN